MSRLHWMHRLFWFCAAVLAFGAGACESVGDAASLSAQLEQRYPNSEIEISDLHEGEAQNVEVRISAPSFEEDMNLAEEAPYVARLIEREYDLGRRDTIRVQFQSEQRVGPFESSRSASFEYPAGELSAGVDDVP